MSHSINFLHQIEQPERRRLERRRKALRVALFVGAGFFALWLLVVLFAAGQVVAAALDGRDALIRARDAAVALDFETADDELGEADERFASAERGFVLLTTVRFIPWVSTQVDAAEALLGSGREVIGALEAVLELGAELVRLTGFSEEEIRAMADGVAPAATFDDLSSETKRAILDRLASSSDDLELLSARINIARAELADVDRSAVIGPVADALLPFDARLAEAEDTIRTLSIASRLLPEFAGLDRERTHLMLFMNNTELRPGGGFIGTFGVLKTHNGDIVELETRDSYVFDDAAASSVAKTAPVPFQRYNATTKWYFRDANWSPDFAVSALDAIRLYGAELNAIPAEARAAAGLEVAAFDGVIGMTPTFLQALLGIVGPLTVGGQTFSADNVTDKLEYQVEVGYAGQGIPEAQRKDVIADLMNAVKSSLFSRSISEWERVLAVIRQAFEEKQLVLMSADAQIEDLLTDVGWGGRVMAADGDAIMLVDASLASLKTDPKVSRAIRHELFRNTSGQYVARTSMRYTHTGNFDWKTTRYRTYARLFVPSGSELIRVEGSMLNDAPHNPTGAAAPVDQEEDLGFTSFGTFISIEPGESRTLQFEYLLPESVAEQINDGTYELTVLKQIGAQDYELTLDLDFDKNVTAASIPEDRGEWGDDVYRLNTKLDQDLEFVVEL